MMQPEHSLRTLLGSRLEKRHSKETVLGKWREVRCGHMLETAEGVVGRARGP